MAVDPSVQHQGIGGQLLTFLETHVHSRRDNQIIWCNAREPAVAFYQMHGWEVVSQSFDISTISPHRWMVKRL